MFKKNKRQTAFAAFLATAAIVLYRLYTKNL